MERFNQVINESSDRGNILRELRKDNATLTSKPAQLSSVLYKYMSITDLEVNASELIGDIIK